MSVFLTFSKPDPIILIEIKRMLKTTPGIVAIHQAGTGYQAEE